MKGAVYRLRRPREARGHEQRGHRYAVVVQATYWEHLSTWVVIPTSASPTARRSVLRPEVDFGEGTCVALVDAMYSVDPEHRLGDRVGAITAPQLRLIEQAVKDLLELNLRRRVRT